MYKPMTDLGESRLLIGQAETDTSKGVSGLLGLVLLYKIRNSLNSRILRLQVVGYWQRK
jgi:hypothetical protein